MIKFVFSIVLSGVMGVVIAFGWYIVTNDDMYEYEELLKYVNEKGFVYFTNMPPSKGYGEIISERSKNISDYKGNKSRASYRQIIYSAADKYNIDPALINAVIRVESNWDTNAVSRKGAKGLMQLMPATAKKMNVKNPFNPEENIEGGIKYLRYLLDKYNGDLSLALAAYNAGPQKIEQFRGIPPIKETKQYVKRVLLLYSGKKDSSF